MANTLSYLVLGSNLGDKLDVAKDLIEFGIGREEKAVVSVSQSDSNAIETVFETKGRESSLAAYEWPADALPVATQFEVPYLFIVADSKSDPADVIESYFYWLEEAVVEQGRVITVVDCQLLVDKPELQLWYDCCIHFSDVVLLANRSSVSNKWIAEFKDRYLKEYYPCLFEFVKKGRVSNPALLLDPTPRRISMLFDPVEDIQIVDEFEAEFEDDDDEEEDEPSIAGIPQEDKFLKRITGQYRDIELPDIRKSLG